MKYLVSIFILLFVFGCRQNQPVQEVKVSTPVLGQKINEKADLALDKQEQIIKIIGAATVESLPVTKGQITLLAKQTEGDLNGIKTDAGGVIKQGNADLTHIDDLTLENERLRSDAWETKVLFGIGVALAIACVVFGILKMPAEAIYCGIAGVAFMLLPTFLNVAKKFIYAGAIIIGIAGAILLSIRLWNYYKKIKEDLTKKNNAVGEIVASTGAVLAHANIPLQDPVTGAPTEAAQIMNEIQSKDTKDLVNQVQKA